MKLYAMSQMAAKLGVSMPRIIISVEAIGISPEKYKNGREGLFTSKQFKMIKNRIERIRG